MHRIIHVLLAVLGVFSGTGCNRKAGESPAPTPEETQAVTDQGQAAAQSLMQSLGGQLKAAIQSGGPVQAIEVCQQAAQPMTAAAGEAFEGVTVRRTTLKPRNPVNAPDKIDREVLEKLEGMSPPEPLIEWQDEVARYYQPLMIQEVCLNCHGDSQEFPGELAEKLADLYPDDQATGYSLGDFRGVIRVDINR